MATPTMSWVRRLPVTRAEAAEETCAAREAMPGALRRSSGRGRRSGVAPRSESAGAAGGGGGAAARRPPRARGSRAAVAFGASSLRFWTRRWASAFASGSLCRLADGVGAPDRIGLPEQVVAQADLRIRVGAADLRERGARPRAHLVGCDAEQGADVLVALPALEQQLEHRALFIRDRHERGSLGQRVNARCRSYPTFNPGSHAPDRQARVVDEKPVGVELEVRGEVPVPADVADHGPVFGRSHVLVALRGGLDAQASAS